MPAFPAGTRPSSSISGKGQPVGSPWACHGNNTPSQPRPPILYGPVVAADTQPMTSLRTGCLCTTFAFAVVVHVPAPVAAQTLVPQTPAPKASRAFSGLFQDTVTDFRGLASTKPLTILGIGAIAAAAVHVADPSMTSMLATERASFLGPGETIGSARMQLAGALATFAAGHITGNAKITAVGADLVSANIVAQTLTGAV